MVILRVVISLCLDDCSNKIYTLRFRRYVRHIVANESTHRKGSLYHGVVDPVRRTIRCPLHQTLFDLRTGKKLAGPTCEDLQVKKL